MIGFSKPRTRLLSQIRVLPGLRTPLAGAPLYRRGRLIAGQATLVCALGRTGITRHKMEGDGGTPSGVFSLTGGYFRPGRPARIVSALPLRAIRRHDGWCDDPASPAYNRPVRLPSRYGHEEMWRQDHLYDLVLVISHNLQNRSKGRGSAIFLHLATPDFRPTAGCVALQPGALRKLLPRLARNAKIIIAR